MVSLLHPGAPRGSVQLSICSDRFHSLMTGVLCVISGRIARKAVAGVRNLAGTTHTLVLGDTRMTDAPGAVEKKSRGRPRKNETETDSRANSSGKKRAHSSSDDPLVTQQSADDQADIASPSQRAAKRRKKPGPTSNVIKSKNMSKKSGSGMKKRRAEKQAAAEAALNGSPAPTKPKSTPKASNNSSQLAFSAGCIVLDAVLGSPNLIWRLDLHQHATDTDTDADGDSDMSDGKNSSSDSSNQANGDESVAFTLTCAVDGQLFRYLMVEPCLIQCPVRLCCQSARLVQ